MKQERREEIDRLVDVFLDDLESLSRDAGWSGMGLLDKLMMPFGPQNPNAIGNRVINEIRLLKAPHAMLPAIQAAVRLLFKRNSHVALAILSSRYYRHSYVDPVTNTEKQYKDTNRASLVGQTPRQYRLNLEKAYPILDEILGAVLAGMELAVGKKCA